MRIGPLRHRVTIQQKSTAQNAFGEEAITYSDIATNPSVWANVRPATGRESFVAGADQQLSELSHRVQIRYRTDLSVEMRVVWESRNLDIESIHDPSGKREFLNLLCREVQT
jgi:SPP1 family predicted phage head-tail adaptor